MLFSILEICSSSNLQVRSIDRIRDSSEIDRSGPEFEPYRKCPITRKCSILTKKIDKI